MSELGPRPLDLVDRDNCLVGRDGCLAVAADAVENGGGVLVVGASGIGRSALLAALLDAEDRRPGTKVLRLAAGVPGPGIPFGAFAPHVPEIRGLPGAARDPFYLLQSVRKSIIATAGGGRLVIGVDDAHRLDEPSATVLVQMVTTGDAVVVISALAGERLPGPIRLLWKDGLVERIDLAPLDVAAIVAMAERIVGGPLDGDLSESLARASSGNPLYLRELILAGVENGRIVNKHGVWSLEGTLAIGPRLTELLDERLADVAPGLIGWLEVVAFGDPLPETVFRSMIPQEDADTLQRLGLLSVDEPPLDDFAPADRFARPGHPLYGDLIRARITARRETELRLMLAEAFEAAGRMEGDLSRVVAWRLDAGDRPAAGTLLRASIRAAERADWRLSARLASAALEGGAGQGGTADAAALVLAEALGRLGQFNAALSVLEGHRETNDQERARLAVFRSSVLFWGLGRFEEAGAALAEAERRISAADERAWVGAVRAGMLTALGRPAQAVESARAVASATYLTERAADAAQSALAMGLVWSGRTEQGLALAQIPLGAGSGRCGGTSHADRWPVEVKFAAYRLAGTVPEMAELAGEEYRLAVQRHNREAKAAAAAALGWVAVMRGQLTRAAMRLREALGSLEGPDASAGRGQALMTLAEAVALTGDSVTAGDVLAEARQEMFAAPDWAAPRLHWCAAWAAASRSELSLAMSELKIAADVAAETGQSSFELLALAALTRLGSPDGVARVAELASWVEGPLVQVVAKQARALGAGSPEQLEEVCDDYELLGLTLYAAEAAAQASRMHATRGQPRRTAATAVRAQNLLSGGDSPRPLTVMLASSPASLTRREREVALLARSGLSSQAIASRLHLSVRTVDTHLARVYHKLGVTRRGDLPGVLDGEGETTLAPDRSLTQ